MRPEVGFESNSIVLGKHSGRHALRDALEQLGFKIEGNALNAAFKRFKEIADRKKQVTALDLEAIVSDEMRERAGHPRAGLVRGRGGPRGVSRWRGSP
jgi:2-isopropylmalate synthase